MLSLVMCHRGGWGNRVNDQSLRNDDDGKSEHHRKDAKNRNTFTLLLNK